MTGIVGPPRPHVPATRRILRRRVPTGLLPSAAVELPVCSSCINRFPPTRSGPLRLEVQSCANSARAPRLPQETALSQLDHHARHLQCHEGFDVSHCRQRGHRQRSRAPAMSSTYAPWRNQNYVQTEGTSLLRKLPKVSEIIRWRGPRGRGTARHRVSRWPTMRGVHSMRGCTSPHAHTGHRHRREGRGGGGRGGPHSHPSCPPPPAPQAARETLRYYETCSMLREYRPYSPIHGEPLPAKVTQLSARLGYHDIIHRPVDLGTIAKRMHAPSSRRTRSPASHLSL
jgi:hypothetical protein